MRKIILNFDNAAKVRKLKKLMKQVYKSGSNKAIDLSKFDTGKSLIPEQVERAEIEITRLLGSNITINVPKNYLTFLIAESPFYQVSSYLETENKYIVLPWNINSFSGIEELKSTINQITTSATSLKYTVFVNSEESKEYSRESKVQTELSLSESVFEDNTDELFNRIQELEGQIRLLEQNLNHANSEILQKQDLITAKDNEINGINNQIVNLNSQITGLNSQLTSLKSTNSSLQASNNSYYNQIRQLNNRPAVSDSYTMTLSGTGGAINCGIGTQSIDFGSYGKLTFAKPINLSVTR